MKLTKITRLAYAYLNVILFKKRYPFYLDMRLTNRCNNKCMYCEIPSKYKNKREMTTKEIFNLIDKVEKYCCYIVLSGGEPLLREDIGEIIDYIQSKDGIYCVLVSNGKLVPEKIDQIKRVDELVISLDGPKKINDKLRGKGSYDVAIKTIKTANQARIKVVTNTVLTKENINDLGYILNLSTELGFKCMFQPMTISTAPKNISKNLIVNQYIKQINQLINNKQVKLSDRTLKNFKNYPNNSCQGLKSKRISYFVDADGLFYSCFNSLGKTKGTKIENIKDLNKVNFMQDNNCWCNDKIEIKNRYMIY